jgi:iron complex transport system ATP-binding protein
MEIQVRNLHFAYGSHKVLRDISFDAGEGELLCILGPNGVGKSTLFRCLLGHEKPASGEVLIDGRPAGEYKSSQLARLVSYVPQAHTPTFDYTVLEVVLMGTSAHIGGLSAPKRQHVEMAESAMARVGIADLSGRGYQHISGGERQLALIARALAQQTPVIVMDEPASNLDYGNSLRLMQQVKALTEQGLTFIMSTHDPDHALLFADRILALKGGRVAAFGKVEDVVTEALIETLYGVDVQLRKSENGRYLCEPVC